METSAVKVCPAILAYEEISRLSETTLGIVKAKKIGGIVL
jgi:hypothetical protein